MNYIVTITITFSFGAVVGYFSRLFIEDKVIRKRDRDNRYALAYNTFSKEFTPALHLLGDPKQSSYVIVADEFPKHKAALLAFEHIIRDTKSGKRFAVKWTEYEKTYEGITQHGYSLFLGKEEGPPSAGILEHTIDCQTNMTELEKDKPNKEKLKQVINELLEIAKP